MALVFVAGIALRAVGFTRGASDFVLPEDEARGYHTAFYTFHPDELTIVESALQPIDLLDPPFTVYGTLPVYGLRGALLLGAVLGDWGPLELDSPDGRRHIWYTARALAVAASCGALLLVWRLGCRLLGPWPGLAAAFITALSPGAIQQAHFYIVDGLFALASLAALASILQALERRRRLDFALAGLLIGATMSIRFNGGLLGLVLLGGLVLASAGSWRARAALALRDAGLWTAAAVAFALFAVLQVYIFVRPQLLTAERGIGDFSLTMKFANGTYLQPWTLVDARVTPYLDHWFGMWPLVSGWPLTLLFLAALAWGAWRGPRAMRLLVLWTALYFLPIGALPARAVRHMVPLLAPLALLTVAALGDRYRALPVGRGRQVAAVVTGLAALHLFAYGTAFARVYTVEDGRIQAGRFLANRLSPGAHIAVEGGAFSVSGLVSDRRHRRLWMDESRLLYNGPYMLCGDRVDYLRRKLERADAIVYADVNRAAQYAAVPDLFPVAAQFYPELEAGQLGFDAKRRYKTYPVFAGIPFRDDGVDPSFLGYDHPAVTVLLRRRDADLPAEFGRWRERMAADPGCPDAALRAAAHSLLAGDGVGAAVVLDSLTARQPHALLAYRLRAEAAGLMGDTVGVEAALRRYRPATAGGRMAHVFNPGVVHFVTGSSALSLVHLGLHAVALSDLTTGVRDLRSIAPSALQSRALTYLEVADAFADSGMAPLREEVTRLSLQISLTAEGHNALANILARRGDLGGARKALERSLLLDANQGEVHLALGELHIATHGDLLPAVHHLERAAQLRPDLAEKALGLRDRLLRAVEVAATPP